MLIKHQSQLHAPRLDVLADQVLRERLLGHLEVNNRAIRLDFKGLVQEQSVHFKLFEEGEIICFKREALSAHGVLDDDSRIDTHDCWLHGDFDGRKEDFVTSRIDHSQLDSSPGEVVRRERGNRADIPELAFEGSHVLFREIDWHHISPQSVKKAILKAAAEFVDSPS